MGNRSGRDTSVVQDSSSNRMVISSANSLMNTGKQLFCSLLSVVGWKTVPIANLGTLESSILAHLRHTHHGHCVTVGADRHIWTLSVNVGATRSSVTPLVVLHGIAGGVALWVLNLDGISTNRPVYVIDILGFGRSSRPIFNSDPVLAELELVESLEQWRKEMCLDKFVLLGHCFGGYLAASYAVRYPDRIRHLILVNPWGFSERTPSKQQIPIPIWVKMIILAAQPFNPFALLRLSGMWGPALVARFKPDLIQDYSELFTDDTIAQYLYLWNAQNPTGETAFKHMSYDFGWATYPMIHRVKDIPPHISMTMIFGSRSWVDSDLGKQIKDLREESYVDVEIIRGAGHFVFADKPELFNTLVNRTCAVVDHRLDVLQPQGSRSDRRRRLHSESAPDLETFTLAKMHAKRLGRSFFKRNSECMAEVEESNDESPSESMPTATPPLTDSPVKSVFSVSSEDDF